MQYGGLLSDTVYCGLNLKIFVLGQAHSYVTVQILSVCCCRLSIPRLINKFNKVFLFYKIYEEIFYEKYCNT